MVRYLLAAGRPRNVRVPVLSFRCNRSFWCFVFNETAGIRVTWAAAAATDTPEALEGFLQKYPQGPEADQAKVRLARLSGYRVQLATFRSERQAEQTRDRLQGKYGDVLGSVVIVPGATANVHVLRSASMGQGEANNACERLKKDHLTCEVIKDVNS